MTLLINPDRLQADFERLAAIGATGDGGVHRPALSEAHLAARAWLLARAAEAGLATQIDGAGNLTACYPSTLNPQARTLLLGSHTDSVPNGGRFDGALGIVAALEVVRVLKEAQANLAHHVALIDFTDEEGTLVGLLGSAALAGSLTREGLQQPRGGREALEAGLVRAGLTEEGLLQAKRDPQTLAGYLELHIEQGSHLTQQAVAIGVVSGIVGITSYRLTFWGQANHAGTTPMQTRSDAGLGAAAFILTAREMVLRDFLALGCTVNVGQLSLSPGAFNIIPGAAELGLEFRAPEPKTLADLENSLLSLANLIARQYRLQLSLELVGRCPPAPMSEPIQAAIRQAADSLALSHLTLPSGAGHDAQSLATLMPAGMIFVPSRDGLSHSPLEFTEWDACVNGANVLLRAALTLAS